MTIPNFQASKSGFSHVSTTEHGVWFPPNPELVSRTGSTSSKIFDPYLFQVLKNFQVRNINSPTFSSKSEVSHSIPSDGPQPSHGNQSEVRNVSFPDEDLDLSDLGGLLEWLPPVDMSQAGDDGLFETETGYGHLE